MDKNIIVISDSSDSESEKNPKSTIPPKEKDKLKGFYVQKPNLKPIKQLQIDNFLTNKKTQQTSSIDSDFCELLENLPKTLNLEPENVEKKPSRKYKIIDFIELSDDDSDISNHLENIEIDPCVDNNIPICDNYETHSSPVFNNTSPNKDSELALKSVSISLDHEENNCDSSEMCKNATQQNRVILTQEMREKIAINQKEAKIRLLERDNINKQSRKRKIDQVYIDYNKYRAHLIVEQILAEFDSELTSKFIQTFRPTLIDIPNINNESANCEICQKLITKNFNKLEKLIYLAQLYENVSTEKMLELEENRQKIPKISVEKQKPVHEINDYREILTNEKPFLYKSTDQQLLYTEQQLQTINFVLRTNDKKEIVVVETIEDQYTKQLPDIEYRKHVNIDDFHITKFGDFLLFNNHSEIPELTKKMNKLSVEEHQTKEIGERKALKTNIINLFLCTCKCFYPSLFDFENTEFSDVLIEGIVVKTDKTASTNYIFFVTDGSATIKVISDTSKKDHRHGDGLGQLVKKTSQCQLLNKHDFLHLAGLENKEFLKAINENKLLSDYFLNTAVNNLAEKLDATNKINIPLRPKAGSRVTVLGRLCINSEERFINCYSVVRKLTQKQLIKEKRNLL